MSSVFCLFGNISSSILFSPKKKKSVVVFFVCPLTGWDPSQVSSKKSITVKNHKSWTLWTLVYIRFFKILYVSHRAASTTRE